MVLGWLRNRTDCLESQQAQRSERWTEREGIKTAKVRSDQIGNRRRGSLKAVEGGGGWVGGRVARRRGRRETLEEKVWLAPISAELVGAPQVREAESDDAARLRCHSRKKCYSGNSNCNLRRHLGLRCPGIPSKLLRRLRWTLRHNCA